MAVAHPPLSRTEAPSRSWWRRNQQRIAPLIFLAPGLFMFAVYVIIPIFQSMWIRLLLPP